MVSIFACSLTCWRVVRVGLQLDSDELPWVTPPPPVDESRDLDLADPRRRGALGDEERQQRHRVGRRRRIDGPPDRVPSVVAAADRALVAEWAGVARERRERDAALARLVAVMEQVARHPPTVAGRARHDIGAAP